MLENAVLEICFRSRNSIKRLRLPKVATTVQQFIHTMAGSSFDSIHNLSQRIGFSFIAFQRSKEQMDMGRHDDEGMHVDFSAILK